MKRSLAVIAVVCLLSVPALAGEIPTMGAPQPTQVTPSTRTENSPGEIPTSGFTGQIPSGGLSALLEVLSFLM